MRKLPIIGSLINSATLFFAKVREAMTPVEDQWTLTTEDGLCFEGVVDENVVDSDVVIQHNFGESRVPIARLSNESRLKLVKTSKLSFSMLQAA